MKTKKQCVYQLVEICLETNDRALVLKKDKDGCIRAWQSDIGIYLTEKEAEASLKKRASDTDRFSIIGGFLIYKRALGADYSYYTPELTISYDSKGNKITEAINTCEDTQDKEVYFGTDPKDIKFKQGDLCYYLSSYRGEIKFVPCIVEPPYTKEEWKKQFKDYGSNSYGDNCYLIVGPHGHGHPFITEVFPLIGKVSKKVRSMIVKQCDEYWGPYKGHSKMKKAVHRLV